MCKMCAHGQSCMFLELTSADKQARWACGSVRHKKAHKIAILIFNTRWLACHDFSACWTHDLMHMCRPSSDTGGWSFILYVWYLGIHAYHSNSLVITIVKYLVHFVCCKTRGCDVWVACFSHHMLLMSKCAACQIVSRNIVELSHVGLTHVST